MHAEIAEALAELAEMFRIKKRIAAGGKKLIKTTKTSTADKMKAKRWYRSNKSQVLRHRAKVAKTAKFKRRQNFLSRMHHEGTETLRDRMSSLIEGLE